ncbi:MAG: hypothetical protein KGN78_09735 [Actinomycetales bacterium]|nr:hypothetical protein [Actinomycetales bacterium]
MDVPIERTRRIVIRLDDPEQLFYAKPPHPSSPDYTEFTAQPAMDTVRDILLMRLPTRHTRVEIDLVLPAKKLHAGLDEELTTAVRRWVRVQNRMQGEASEVEGVVGRRLFILGALAFLVFQSLSIVVRNHGELWGNIFVNDLGEGLGVASWVMLWVPVQIFTIEAWRSAIARRRFRTLERVSVRTHARETYVSQEAESDTL